jgi:hypothetical protein
MSDRIEAVAELIAMCGEDASVEAVTNALEHLSMVVEERDRYRRGLVWIADRESGVWGIHARRVLYGEAA